MTAQEIQTAIIKQFHDKDLCMPNFYHGLWECDVFRLQPNGYIIEYEVKVSKSDFLADFKKKRSGIEKHKQIEKGGRCNRFYFVAPQGLVTVEDIPPYCGLIVYEGGELKTLKRAKLLHKNQVKPDYYKHLSMKLFYRLRDSKQNLPKNGKSKK